MTRTLLSACTVEELIRSALGSTFNNGEHRIQLLAPAFVYLRQRRPNRPMGRTTRPHSFLLDPLARIELPGAWGRSEDKREGNWHGFRPTSSLGFGWTSGSGCQLLAIPVAGGQQNPLGYILELRQSGKESSGYARIFGRQSHWQAGCLLPSGADEVDSLRWLEDSFPSLLAQSR